MSAPNLEAGFFHYFFDYLQKVYNITSDISPYDAVSNINRKINWSFIVDAYFKILFAVQDKKYFILKSSLDPDCG